MSRLLHRLAERSTMMASVWGYWRLLRGHVETRVRFSGAARDRFLVPDRTIFVQPARIRRFARSKQMPPRHRLTPVMPGDWDVTAIFLDNQGFYDDLRAVSKGASWESTRIYERGLAVIGLEGANWHGKTSREQFDREWCGQWDRLLESIRRDGYLSQSRLRRTKAVGGVAYLSDEVTVAIGRDGSFLLWEGAHRTSWATVLGIEEIPAQVIFRHSEWAALRKSLDDYARVHGGKILEPLLHPDLDNIPAGRDRAFEFDQIQKALGTRSGTLVDLTPGWGSLCERFERAGFRCTAIVEAAEDEHFLRAMQRAQETRFDAVEPADMPERPSFDVALALDWARDATNGGKRFERLTGLLAGIDARELFVGVPRSGGPGPEGPEPVDSVLSTCAQRGGFVSWYRVGECDAETDMYRFCKPGGC